MYGSVLGGTTAGAGVLVLPETGGNSALTVAAYASIVIGVAIIVTSIARIAAKKAYKA